MRKDRAFGLLFLVLLLASLGRASAQEIPSGSNVLVTCHYLTLKGQWDNFHGFYAKIEGNCSAVLVNPTNMSIGYKYAGWESLKFSPHDMNLDYPSFWFPNGWVEPGGTLRGNLSIKGSIWELSELVELLNTHVVSIFGVGTIEMNGHRTGNTTIPVSQEFRLKISPSVKVEWSSVLPAVSTSLLPFLWFILGILMATVNRESEPKVWGWSTFASYGLLVGLFFGRIIMFLTPETQLFAILSIEFSFLAAWLSVANRTTPKKPGEVTTLLGNAVLLFLGLSILTVIAGGYIEKSLGVVGGITALTFLFIALSYSLVSSSIGEEEKNGRIPRVNTRPLSLGILLLPYPVLVVFWFIGWETGIAVVATTTVLLFIIGLKLTRKAEESEEIEFKSL